MSKFQFVRVQIVEEEVFKIPKDWDIKDVTYRHGELFYKGKVYRDLPSMTLDNCGEAEVFLEDDDGLEEMYMDAMPDSDEESDEDTDEDTDESEEETEEEDDNESKERQLMQKEDKV